MFDRRYTVEINDRPDVLARIVTLCNQRRCSVTALSYRAGDRHRAAELVLGVRASSWHGDRLASWLSGLVDVLEVRELGAPRCQPAPRPHPGVGRPARDLAASGPSRGTQSRSGG